MVEREELLQLLPPFTNTKKLVTNDQGTGDIIKEIENAHYLYAGDYDKISSLFWQGDPVSTAEYIFDYAKENIKYCIEPSTRQSVKSPAAIVATGIYKDGYNDCKHYSLFIAGILDSLRRMGYPIDWEYRFASYSYFNTSPQHVFVVLNYRNKEYWIDPVLPDFDNRNPYTKKTDKKINMALYQISGVPTQQDNEIDIPADVSMKAYLIMLSNNLLGAASTMASCIINDSTAVQSAWESCGGDWNKLVELVFNSKDFPSGQADARILAIAYPVLYQLALVCHNSSLQYQESVAGESLKKLHSIGTDRSTLGDSIVENVAQSVPGIVTAVDAAISFVKGIFGGGDKPVSPNEWSQRGIDALNNAYNSEGAIGVYKQFCGRTFRLGSDYNTIYVASGQAAPGGGETYVNSGYKLTTLFPNCNAKDLAGYVLTEWPKGAGNVADFNASWNSQYLTALSHYATGTPLPAATVDQATPTVDNPGAPVVPDAPGADSNKEGLFTPTTILAIAAVAITAAAVSKHK